MYLDKIGSDLMPNIDLFTLFFRFLLGGCVVAVSTLAAKNSKSQLGGILGAFPAIYLATVLGLSMDYKENDLLLATAQLSKGSFAGLLAAFPVIMSASVIVAGHFGNSKQASDIALGASTGILACISFIFTVILCIEYLKSWSLLIIIALSVWFLSAYLANYLINVFLKKYMGAVHE